MANSRKKEKVNVPMCLACVLFCLTLFSMHFTGGLYAKYTAKGNGGDSARVAAFNVVTTGNGDLHIHCDAPEDGNKYTITVTNNSEVAVRYNLSVVIPDASTTGVTAVFDTASGELAVGAGPAVHTLIFEVDWNKFTASASGDVAIKEIKFTVIVDTVQID